MLSPEVALIHAMVLAAAAGRGLEREDLEAIAGLAGHLPMFEGMDAREVRALATGCAEQLRSGGSAELYRQIRRALPGRLREAAYALACDVLVLCRRPEVAQALEEVRTGLEVDPATARAIDRAARERIPTAAKDGLAQEASAAAGRPSSGLPQCGQDEAPCRCATSRVITAA